MRLKQSHDAIGFPTEKACACGLLLRGKKRAIRPAAERGVVYDSVEAVLWLTYARLYRTYARSGRPCARVE